MKNKGGRPKGAALPQRERMIDLTNAIFDELQELRERAAHFENLVDEKNVTIKALKTNMSLEAKDIIKELLTPAMAYGMLMREMRKEAGLSGAEMARKLYLSTSQLSKMENGDPLTSLDTIKISYEKIRELKIKGELNNGKNKK